jgi:predicted nucleotidyltransferase
MIKIVEMSFGSIVYGTNLPTSDQDFKAVAIPDVNDILLQRSFKTVNLSTGNDQTRNTKDDIDRETFSLHYFMNLLTQGQTVCLDMLFTPEKFYTETPRYLWLEIFKNKDKLISKKMNSFAGYCQAQAAKYSLKGSYLNAYEATMEFFEKHPSQLAIKKVDLSPLLLQFKSSVTKALNGKDIPVMQIVEIPNNKGVLESYLQVGPKTKIPLNAKCHLGYEIMKNQYDKYGARAKMAQTNEGIDWKALMHAVRVCDEAIELCETKNIIFPRPNAQHLLKIRKGELPYTEISE